MKRLFDFLRVGQLVLLGQLAQALHVVVRLPAGVLVLIGDGPDALRVAFRRVAGLFESIHLLLPESIDEGVLRGLRDADDGQGVSGERRHDVRGFLGQTFDLGCRVLRGRADGVVAILDLVRHLLDGAEPFVDAIDQFLGISGDLVFKL